MAKDAYVSENNMKRKKKKKKDVFDDDCYRNQKFTVNVFRQIYADFFSKDQYSSTSQFSPNQSHAHRRPIEVCKMRNFTIGSIPILVAWLLCHAMPVDGRKRFILNLREPIDWNLDTESLDYPATNIEENLVTEGDKTRLQVLGDMKEENFTLALFAIPLINATRNTSKGCPPTLSADQNLRQHDLVCTMLSGDPTFNVTYIHIFTGCYYLVMIDSRGNHFQSPPEFHQSSFPFYDTKLKIRRNTTKMNENVLESRELIDTVEVPLLCLKIRARLWEFQGDVSRITRDMAIEEIMREYENQICTIGNDGPPSCQESNLTRKAEVRVTTEKMDNRWKAVIEWRNLSRGPHTYYLRYEPVSDSCDCKALREGSPENLRKWSPDTTDVLLRLGYLNESNAVPMVKGPDDTFNWLLPVSGVVGAVIVMAMLSYFIYKYHNLVMNERRREKESVEEPQVTISTSEVKESGKILLMYEKDSPLFMKAMDAFRRRLERDCGGFEVHDVYAMNEFDKVSELGVPGWVHELLKEGSKIVWVDTPRFRSRFNDEEEQHSRDDFRADAIPYGVKVAMDSFQNPMTQYRRHFVVRVKGFEVQDGGGDPLKTISPRKRYHIPEQISQLCEDLEGPR